LLLRPARLDRHVAAHDETVVAQALAERLDQVADLGRGMGAEEADHRHRRLGRRARPRQRRHGRGSEQGPEFPAPPSIPSSMLRRVGKGARTVSRHRTILDAPLPTREPIISALSSVDAWAKSHERLYTVARPQPAILPTLRKPPHSITSSASASSLSGT